MYLLNPVVQNGDVVSANRFTFHYVSIKSGSTHVVINTTYKFTFHYVSIKSGVPALLPPLDD